MKKKAFTLIELIAVLVILAILALIVTPLVMSIIRKARISADKRSIDAYGRSIELAIAGYLMDTGSFPTSIEQLTIEYSGDEVVCSTTQLNGDSSVYLTGCIVGGRSVDYSYGTDKTPPAPTYTAYSVGDTVTYNSINYYVIKDSGTSESTVTLLKAEPLTVAEVNEYGGVGSSSNHINVHSGYDGYVSYYQTAYDYYGYGGMAYYSSETCGYIYTESGSHHSGSSYTGCTNSYAQSEIKYVVDAWGEDQAPLANEARLITLDDLPALGYELQPKDDTDSSLVYKKTSSTPNWVYDSNCWYWTMIPYEDSTSSVWVVYDNGTLGANGVSAYSGVVRPVITISKTNLSS